MNHQEMGQPQASEIPSEATGVIKAAVEFIQLGDQPFQEDALLAETEQRILAVADGFGGPDVGLKASRLACDSVHAFLEKEAGDRDATLPFVLRSYMSLLGNVLFNAVIHANQEILKSNEKKSPQERGGASLIAAYLDGDLLALASVGACSSWLVRQGKMVRLTSPRTYERLCDPFSEADGVPLQALGISKDLEPEIVEYRVQPGDWLILNTGSLSEELKEEISQLQSLQSHFSGIEESRQNAESALELFKRKSGRDKLSIILSIF